MQIKILLHVILFNYFLLPYFIKSIQNIAVTQKSLNVISRFIKLSTHLLHWTDIFWPLQQQPFSLKTKSFFNSVSHNILRSEAIWKNIQQ